LAALLACLSVSLQSQQAPQDSRPQATFKTGIDVVQLDVSVFDKDRRSIRGLTLDDFTVLENGKPQPIVAVVPVDVADPPAASAAWLREAPLDVVTNAGETRRLITIVMDDAGMGVEHGEPMSARKIANGILDQLGPDDLVSVVFTFLGRPQNWTADRSRLRAAVESLAQKFSAVPSRQTGGIAPGTLPAASSATIGGVLGPPIVCKFRPGGCLVDTLQNVGTALQGAPPGRKIIMLISTNGALYVHDLDQTGYVQDMFRALQRANVSVYAFDPRGLTTTPVQQETDDLWSIADATGGYAVTNTNTPELRVPDVFRENSSYYLIGFRPTDARRDGRFRRVQVRVNRPSAEVRTRRGFVAPSDSKSASKTQKPLTALDAALTGVAPSSDVPISLSVAAFAIPGKHEAVLTLVSGLTHAGGAEGSTRRVNVVASVFDLDAKERGTHRQTLEMKPQADGFAFDVYSRIPTVKPGRYEVRFAAESDGRAGSVFADVDVPEFWKEDLALSGILVERSSSTHVANPDELTSVTNVKPTASRTFARDDRVRALVRVYQKGRKSVRVAARVVNERNDSVFARTDDLADAAFSGGAADYHVEIPLAQLVPGQYLLTVEATAADKRLTRDVRFAVR
jgi:VWFA-related protein